MQAGMTQIGRQCYGAFISLEQFGCERGLLCAGAQYLTLVCGRDLNAIYTETASVL